MRLAFSEGVLLAALIKYWQNINHARVIDNAGGSLENRKTIIEDHMELSPRLLSEGDDGRQYPSNTCYTGLVILGPGLSS